MLTGTRLDERFELEMLAASGGMGHVYRARDLQSGNRVAIKVLARAEEIDAERFSRETEIVATLRHPRIVQYVAHGAAANKPWLAMEWLEGESLATRLARGNLTLDESLAVIRGASEGLAVLHARALVHRDVKPSNLFLVGGEIERLKLLDFGIARSSTGSTLTRTGALVGTPGYVAPEQARGGQSLDARADVFALGCVLFECLTGRPAFTGEHLLAALAKILLEDPPRAGDICGGVPPDLEDLLWRMMSKTPAERPRDASAVLVELAALAPFDARGRARPAAMTSREQRLLSIVVARGEGVPTGFADPSATTAETGRVFSESEGEILRHVRQIASLHDGRIVTLLLPPPALVVVLRSGGAATDLAARAARCALALRQHLPGADLAISTGRGVLTGAGPTGEVIDRGVHLAHTPSGAGVRLDEVTAGLVDGRFDVRQDGGPVLWAERDADDPTRALLGRSTPFVGREDELMVLLRAFEATANDRTARAVVVLGAPGMGKSRLARELCALLQTRNPAPAIWKARGDPMRAGSPFGLLAPAIRRQCAIHEGDAPALQQEKLAARLPGRLPASEKQRICEFVGELAAIRFDDDESPQLKAARRDPMLMSEQIRLAWEDWVAAESAEHPLVLVIEDLHWADMVSTKLIQGLLRRRRDHAVFVLALARPGIAPWQEGGVQQLQLGELSHAASRNLVLSVLGSTNEVADMIATSAAGNALLLEELIRATAEGKGASLPDTVLAVLAARLERLDPEPRRLLRAASIFGATFWASGLAALVGSNDADVREWLAWLIDQELLHQRTRSRFDGQMELAFHHALLRDAAYALLTDTDRTTGHRLAAEWLERAGESDPAVLADHFERGGEPARAIPHHLRLAERSLTGNDLDTALVHAERAIACGAEGETLGRLRLVETTVCSWQGDSRRADEAAQAALALLRRGSPEYYAALQLMADGTVRLAMPERAREALELLMAETKRGPDHLIACVRLLLPMFGLGMRAEAQQLMNAVIIPSAKKTKDPSALAHVYAGRGSVALYEGNPSVSFEFMEKAAEMFEGIGMLREGCSWHLAAAFIALEGGDPLDRAEPLLREYLEVARQLSIHNVVAGALQNLGLACFRRGRLEEAQKFCEESLREFQVQQDLRMEGATHAYLAQVLCSAGDLGGAEREARIATDRLAAIPSIGAMALATLAQVLLAGDRADEALGAAQKAYAILKDTGSVEEGEALVRLMWAEALAATGKSEQARAAFDEAVRELQARAERIDDPVWRRSFLEAVPDNARTLERAARYLRKDSGERR